jgi:hypothetical protein
LALFGDRNQMERETIAALVADQTEKARLAQIEALSTRDPEQAKTVLDGAIERGEIRGTNVTKARTFVETATMDVRSQAARDELIALHPDDEKAAIAAARERYTGQMEDEVVRRVKGIFTERRETVRAIGDDLMQEAINAMGDKGNIDAIPRQTMVRLQTEYREKWNNLRNYAQQLQSGTALISNLDTIQELNDLTPDQWLTTDLNDFRGRLSYDDFRRYSDYQRGIKQPNSGATRAGMTPPEIDRDLFSAAKEAGLIESSATDMTTLRRFPRENEAFGRVRTRVYEQIQAEAGEKKRPLTEPETRAVIERVLDDRVLRTSGLDKPLPRAWVGPNASSREMTPRDSARFDIRPRVDMNVVIPDSATPRARQLIGLGFTPEQVVTTLRQEGLLTPEPR